MPPCRFGSTLSIRLALLVSFFAGAPILVRPFGLASLSASPLSVSDLVSSAPAGPSIDVLRDETAFLRLENVIQSKGWSSAGKENPSYGFTTALYWVRLTLTNNKKDPVHILLEQSYPLIDFIEFYEPTPSGFAKREAGDQHLFRQREIAHRNFIFQLDVPPGQTVYYLRYQSTSSMNIHLRLWKPTAFLENVYWEQLALGIYYGIIGVMILYNLFLFLFVRDVSYLYYVMSIGGYALYQLTLNGHSFQFFWPDNVWWGNAALAFFIYFGTCWALVFTRSLLLTKEKAPFVHKVLTVLIVLTAVGAPLSLAVPYRYGMMAGAGMALISVVFMYSAGWITLIRGYRPARYYLIAWSTLLFGVAVYVLKTFAILPANFVTNWSQQIGSGLEVLLLSLALASRINLLREQSQRAQADLIAKQAEMLAVEKSLADSFARFVPSQFLSFLDRQTISEVRLGDQVQREMTILFADIRSFSQLSERMSPAENFDFLNSYLKRIGPVIRNNNGFIDKFIGDGVMALFPGDPEDALKAAVSMQEAVRQYNHHRMKKNYDPVRIGIGIHTGTLILGTIGEHQRLETTVISDAVNLASRIENLTKRCGAPILISESTLFRVASPDMYALRMLGRVRVKGKDNPVSVFEVYQGQPDYLLELIADTRNQFEHGVSAYYAREYEPALTCFERVLEVNPSDTAAQLYVRSIRRVLALDGQPIQ